MTRGKDISEDIRNQIVGMRRVGRTFEAIGGEFDLNKDTYSRQNLQAMGGARELRERPKIRTTNNTEQTRRPPYQSTCYYQSRDTKATIRRNYQPSQPPRLSKDFAVNNRRWYWTGPPRRAQTMFSQSQTDGSATCIR